ncbi:hypothetical protein [Mangrovimonas xylaniphaga]|uniref:hypothetical protein n=1 Tax=Mangrovimonas xylaniphaga TaxID=1645915 RepID=UPI0006B552C1|nr:hypothetical protein [Mangrovimonas xylaniphaga]
MKQRFVLLLLVMLLTSCGVYIKFVVDYSGTNRPYGNPLIVIPYERGSTRNFTNKLKENMEAKFEEDAKQVEILLFEKAKKGLTLNTSEGREAQVNSSIVSGNKDLLLLFNPTNMQYYNGGLISVTYELVGIDTQTNKEVWKATFNSSSSLGPAMFAEKSAKTIFEKLKADKVI